MTLGLLPGGWAHPLHTHGAWPVPASVLGTPGTHVALGLLFVG